MTCIRRMLPRSSHRAAHGPKEGGRGDEGGRAGGEPECQTSEEGRGLAGVPDVFV